MSVTSAAQKQWELSPAADPVFTPEFYRPYEAAAKSVLMLISGAANHLPAGETVCAVTYRLKTPSSIRGKLIKKGLPPSASAADTSLRDIAGLRVVLPSIDAVYRFADILLSSPGAQCIAVSDYIASPKKSGYKSLHLLFSIPVTLGGKTLSVPAEIQLRTSAMDLWASIEHGIFYKPQRT